MTLPPSRFPTTRAMVGVLLLASVTLLITAGSARAEAAWPAGAGLPTWEGVRC